MALEGAKDIAGAVVFGKVVLVAGKLGFDLLEIVLAGLEGAASVCDSFRFGAGASRRGEDSILNEGLSQIPKFLVYPVPDGFREIFLKLVDLNRSVMMT